MSTARKAAPTLLVIAGLMLGTAGEAAAQVAQPHGPADPAVRPYAPGEIVVRYRSGTTRSARAEVRADLGATVESVSTLKGLQVLDLPPGTPVSSAVDAAQSEPQVLYAEPNYRVGHQASPNDPMFDEMWALGLANSQGVNSGIDTPRVWNLTTGSPDVTVAVVDSGIDATHPDLAPNMWTNPGEVAGNGEDDDGNGMIDDTSGWDWVGGDNSPADENGHGTHVAGIVGARGNNGAGVTGVSWEVRLVSLRVLDGNGSGWTSDVADAFVYAGKMGVDVVNASLAGPAFSEAVLEAMGAAPNTLFVVAAGNSSQNVALTPSYPCSYPLPNIICVAATGQSNQLSSYSNWGAAVDLAAPGDQILSTWPGGTYSELWGTSMATPHVSGLAALLAAAHPGTSADGLRAAILAGAEPLSALAGRTATGGRLSAAGAFEQMGDAVPEEQQPDRLSDDPRNQDQKKKRCASRRRGHKRARRRACRSRG
ncbi:MAG: S8 family peptidase [Actinomycetota bacterium]